MHYYYSETIVSVKWDKVNEDYGIILMLSPPVFLKTKIPDKEGDIDILYEIKLKTF